MAVTGYVIYDVIVTCPHCNSRLNLNKYPYDDEATDYSLGEDELGLALFGRSNEPANWNRIQIEYKCCKCDKSFVLSNLAT